MKLADYKKWCVIAGLLAAIAGCQNEDDTARAFFDDETGQWVVAHPETGKLWLRCDIGQTWNRQSGRCTGERLEMIYSEALLACPDGFSMPSNADMASVLCNLVDEGEYGHRKYDPCSECSTCDYMFPDEKGGYFSSTTYTLQLEDSKKIASYEFEFWAGYVWGLYTDTQETANVTCVKDE